MNPQNEKSPLSLMNVPPGMVPLVSGAAEGSLTSAGSDCLYRFAALTAGVFLLATLL
jgi:hypothetical protein